MARLIGWILVIAMDVPLLTFRGLVLSYFWLWFVVPLGAPAIGIAWSIGLSMLAGMATKQPCASEKDDGEDVLIKTFSRMVGLSVGTLLMWGVGAGVHGFM